MYLINNTQSSPLLINSIVDIFQLLILNTQSDSVYHPGSQNIQTRLYTQQGMLHMCIYDVKDSHACYHINSCFANDTYNFVYICLNSMDSCIPDLAKFHFGCTYTCAWFVLFNYNSTRQYL